MQVWKYRNMDEFLAVCDTLKEKGIQPIATGGSDKWPTTRIVNAMHIVQWVQTQ